MSNGTNSSSQCPLAYRLAVTLSEAASIGDQLAGILKQREVWASLPAEDQRRVDRLLDRWVRVVEGPARTAEREAEAEWCRPKA